MSRANWSKVFNEYTVSTILGAEDDYNDKYSPPPWEDRRSSERLAKLANGLTRHGLEFVQDYYIEHSRFPFYLPVFNIIVDICLAKEPHIKRKFESRCQFVNDAGYDYIEWSHQALQQNADGGALGLIKILKELES